MSGLIWHQTFWVTLGDIPERIFFKNKWAATWDFQQCDLCSQQSLKLACPQLQSDQSLFQSLEYSMNIKLLGEHHLEFPSWKGGCTAFGASAFKRRLHRLVWVYTCQNATLLEITCHGSYINRWEKASKITQHGKSKWMCHMQKMLIFNGQCAFNCSPR